MDSLFFLQEMIFYTVPPFAAENYRNSIESHVIRYEVTLHKCDSTAKLNSL